MDLRTRSHQLLDLLPDEQLSLVTEWLEMLAENPDVEIEELFLLRSGALKQLADEAETQAEPIEDWRQYLDEL